MKLKIDEQNGFQKFEARNRSRSSTVSQTRRAGVKFGDTVTFDLDAYEQLVAEMRTRVYYVRAGSPGTHRNLVRSRTFARMSVT